MGLFSFFKKKKENDVQQDLSKKYLAIDDKRYDDLDLFGRDDLYQVFKKYQNYDRLINLSDSELVRKKVSDLINDLVSINILCKNYDEFILNSRFNDVLLDDISRLGIMDCLVFITILQRKEYWSGGNNNIYLGYTKNGFIPLLINRVISLFESRV